MDKEFRRLLGALDPLGPNAHPDGSCTFGHESRPLHRWQARAY